MNRLETILVDLKAIYEVRRFFESDAVLTPLRESLASANVVLVHDYDVAEEVARFQRLEYCKFPLPEDQCCWRDLTSLVEGPLHCHANELDEDYAASLASADESMGETILANLTPRGYWDISEDVAQDASSIALAVGYPLEPESAFFRQMYAYYQSGGWPCGWRGSYPSGRMCVYVPEKNVRVENAA